MILITGGTGSMGRRLTRALIGKGHSVRVLTLPGDPQIGPMRALGAEVVEGDVAEAPSLRGIAQGAATVYHLAAVILSPGKPSVFNTVNALGTGHLVAECEQSGVDHFILVSSASVAYPKQNPYSLSKRAAEDRVRHSHLPHWTILRPTLAYEDNGAAEFMAFVRYLGKFPVVPFIGGGKALKRPVHVDDLIDGMVRAAGNPVAFGKIYDFSGGSVLTLRRMAEMILEHGGRRKPILPLPLFFCRGLSLCDAMLARITGRPPVLTWQTISGVTQDAAADPGPAMRELGYSPRSFEEWIKSRPRGRLS